MSGTRPEPTKEPAERRKRTAVLRPLVEAHGRVHFDEITVALAG
jgi:hypothetical protein